MKGFRYSINSRKPTHLPYLKIIKTTIVKIEKKISKEKPEKLNKKIDRGIFAISKKGGKGSLSHH